MNRLKKESLFLLLIFALSYVKAQKAVQDKNSFNILNINYPGLEKVKAAIIAGKNDVAAEELLQYFRKRLTSNGTTQYRNLITNRDWHEKADSALIHKFKPHKGYGYFDYGKDINWQLWPVKDNELRFALHRLEWWRDLGLAYENSGDEKYAKEWIKQFRSWVVKNPQGLSDENDRFAWRALEVSARLKNLQPVFNMFVDSPNFTATFLLEFLNSYTRQTNYMIEHYAANGNHLLFEAQRALAAGCFFPELKNASQWRKSGINILNAEIKKQVLPDGMHFELATNYHIAMINTFWEGLNQARQSGLENEFPEDYEFTIEKMIMAVINLSFPDYTYPMFGDVWLTNKDTMQKQFRTWTKAFPKNKYIQYFATDGKEGQIPPYLSHALTSAGIYNFKNGWDLQSTSMIVKAGPPGGFHSHPDNGTFELWVNGRNFLPDAGCYIYAGDSAIMEQRNWFRQTRIHNTLTLNNENMVITKAHLDKWDVDKTIEVLTYTNPSYQDLNHQRSVLFIDHKYFLIIDNASGLGVGTLGTHFQLKENSNPIYDPIASRVYTTYADGNNLLIQSLNKKDLILSQENGKVSYEYKKAITRPAFVFEKQKLDKAMKSFITILYPYNGNKTPEIKIIEGPGNNYETGNIHLSISIDGKEKSIRTQLY